MSSNCLVSNNDNRKPPPPISKTYFASANVVMRIADLFPPPLFQIRQQQRPRGSLCLLLEYIHNILLRSTPPSCFTQCDKVTRKSLKIKSLMAPTILKSLGGLSLIPQCIVIKIGGAMSDFISKICNKFIRAFHY